MIDVVVKNWALERPDETAILDELGAHTWRELLEAAQTRAEAIAALHPRGRIAVELPHDVSGVALVVATALLGVDTILLSPLHGEAVAQALVQTGQADHLIALRDGRVVELARGDRTRGADPEAAASAHVYVLSSGTTGMPKCSRHSWQSLSTAITRHRSHAGARWLAGYPISHFAGSQVFLHCLLNAGVLAFPRDFAPESAAAALLEHGVHHLNCTPTFVRRLLISTPAAELANVRLKSITLGGEIVDQKLLDSVRAVFPKSILRHVYGSSEAGIVVATDDGKEGFSAAALDSGRIRIVDGELQVARSAGAMRGYAGQGALEEAWIRTGDVVEVVGQRVLFRGRADDVINVGGAKVNPAIVEAVLRQIPGVIDAQVVGHKNPVMGNLVKAILWVATDADQAAIRAEAKKLCRAKLEDYMVPRLFEFSHQFELTQSQKVSRRKNAARSDSER